MTDCIEKLTALAKVPLDIATFSVDATEYKTNAKEIEGMFDKAKPLFTSFAVSPYNSLQRLPLN